MCRFHASQDPPGAVQHGLVQHVEALGDGGNVEYWVQMHGAVIAHIFAVGALRLHIAALVEKIHSAGITLTLVNLHPSQKREVIVQSGSYGEHQFESVAHRGQRQKIGDKHLRVMLDPGSVGTLEIGMRRFVASPTYATPWHDGGKIPIR